MFDSAALNVVIGLVVIYLLYSLLLTIISEILATTFNLRAVILRISIERMLNDGYYRERIKAEKNIALRTWKWLTVFFSWLFMREPADFKYSFAGYFYQYPAIRYLAKIDIRFGVRQNKPSYITAEYFANTLMDILKDKGEGSTLMERVGFALKYNTLQIQPKTIKNIGNLYEGAKGDEASFKSNIIKWYNETQDRTTGWYKRKIRGMLFWMGLFLAVAMNVDSIHIAKILANDKDARRQLVTMGIALSQDSARYQSFVTPGNGAVYTKSVLDSGYTRITKDLNEANLVLGLGWRLDTLTHAEIKNLAEKDDPATFLKVVGIRQPLETSNKHVREYQEGIRQKNSEIRNLARDFSLKLSDTANNRYKFHGTAITDNATRKKFNDSLDILKEAMGGITEHTRMYQAQIAGDSFVLADARKIQKSLMDSLNLLVGGCYISVDTIMSEGSSITIQGYRKSNFREKSCYLLCAVMQDYRLPGFLITALMLMMGAPFWFSLLLKLAAIRGVGVKPEEKKQEDSPAMAVNKPSPPVTSAAIPAPKAIISTNHLFAIEALRKRLSEIPGIRGIRSGYNLVNGQKIKAIEIHVDDNASEQAVKGILGEKFLGFDLIYELYSPARVFVLQPGDEIVYSDLLINRRGTLGGFLIKNNDDSQVYILTCWHVLQGKNPRVKNKAGKEIAERKFGTITPTYDVAFALLDDKSLAKDGQSHIKKKHREIEPADIEKGIRVHFKGATSDTTKTPHERVMLYSIVDKNWKIELPEEMKLMKDLFTITKFDALGVKVTPALPGDSGAVVTDEDGAPLGIVVGGDSKVTYVAKCSNFLGANQPYSEFEFVIS